MVTTPDNYRPPDPYIESGGRSGAVLNPNDPEVAAGPSTHYISMELTGIPPPHEMGQNPLDELEDDMSMAKSIASSVLTADGIHDMTGFMIVCLVILVGDMSRGVMFPTLWPLVDSLGASTVTLGYAVAAFSFGRILVNPIFGAWSVSMGYSTTLTISCSVLFFGTLVYAQVPNVGRPEFLIVAQTLLGIGSGTLGVTRAFVAEVTAKRNRTTYMAWITAVQYAGFTVTPFIGALFTKVLGDGDWSWGPLRLNMYTGPAYFMTIIVGIALLLVATKFTNRLRVKTKKDTKKSHRQTVIDDMANRTTWAGLTVYDACIAGCMLLNVATKGSIASFETMGISYAETHFGLYSAKAGAIVATCGSLGVICLLAMGWLSQKFSDVQLIAGGMVVMSIGIASLMRVHEQYENPTWKYVVAMFLIYTLGYPIGHTAVIGLFSKIVGKRPQGVLMGWFASAGSAARILFPLMSGYVAQYWDIVALFGILTGVLIISTGFLLYCRQTLALLAS